MIQPTGFSIESSEMPNANQTFELGALPAASGSRKSDRKKLLEHLTIQPGVYRHFKGACYEVIGVAPLVDSDVCFVVYRPLYGDRSLVLRRYSDFVSTVNRNGRKEPRFRLLDQQSDSSI